MFVKGLFASARSPRVRRYTMSARRNTTSVRRGTAGARGDTAGVTPIPGAAEHGVCELYTYVIEHGPSHLHGSLCDLHQLLTFFE